MRMDEVTDPAMKYEYLMTFYGEEISSEQAKKEINEIPALKPEVERQWEQFKGLVGQCRKLGGERE